MNKRSFSRYIYAILAIPVIILMRYALMPLIGPGVPYVMLFPVSVAVALLAGMGPAILTGILGSIAIDYLFIEPLYLLEFNVPGISRMAVVVLTSAFVGYVGEMLRAARAKAEKQALELHESQADLNRAQAVAHSGSWRMNVQQNELTWSDENHRIFGIPKGTPITYETFLGTIHPDDKEYVDSKWKAALSGEKYDIEHRIVVNGQIKWVRERAYLEFDKNDALIGGFGITQDNPRRKEAEEALLASETRYRRLFEATRDGILILDADSGRIVDVNPFIEDILGYSHEEFLDKKLWEIGLFKNIAASKESFLELQSKGFVRYENLPLETKDGRHIAVEFVSNVYLVNHKKVIQCNIRDITDRVQAEEALRQAHDELELRVQKRTSELSRVNKELAADITERKLAQERIIADQKQLRLLTAELLLTEERERHEIATALHDSLGPILAFSKRELGTLQKSVPAEVAEALKNISDNIGQAIKQTRTLTFDLSPPTLYTLGFEIAIEELLELFCEEHKMEYSFRNSDAPKPLTDPVKVLLYRSTREMLINIAKHAKAKLVKITLSRVEDDIEITIEDDGKGFNTSALTERPKGLGLFSVRERLRHIGGKLEIESKRGKGTHITLTAPLKIE